MVTSVTRSYGSWNPSNLFVPKNVPKVYSTVLNNQSIDPFFDEYSPHMKELICKGNFGLLTYVGTPSGGTETIHSAQQILFSFLLSRCRTKMIIFKK